jgi:hypothetical protein
MPGFYALEHPMIKGLCITPPILGRISIGKMVEKNELGTFIFRTTGYNSIRTLTARLQYYQAASGGLLASLPLELRLRGKITARSHRTPIYYVDLTIREGTTLEEAIRHARELHHRRVESGFDQLALDRVATHGLANGQFEESEEELADVTEEFHPMIIETVSEKKQMRAPKTR